MTVAAPRTDWLAILAEQAAALEVAASSADPSAPVPDCEGWDVSSLVGHVGAVHRMVLDWTRTGRRRAGWATAPPADDLLAWYRQGWQDLVAHLRDQGPGTVVPTWSPNDDTASFWHRRMAHETAIHALDAHRAAGTEQSWTASDAVAADGVDEALRVFLAGRLGRAGGEGALVQVRVPGRWWSVALHQQVVEVGEPEGGPFADLTPDAVVRGPAPEVYRWVWGRGGDVMASSGSGSRAAVHAVRDALARATQ
jgi:uncharacterized protein (TIGR03083 family)